MLSEIAEENENCSSPIRVAECVEDEQLVAELEEKKERRRKKIISELFETEKTYLHHLTLAHKVIVIIFICYLNGMLLYVEKYCQKLKTYHTVVPLASES